LAPLRALVGSFPLGGLWWGPRFFGPPSVFRTLGFLNLWGGREEAGGPNGEVKKPPPSKGGSPSQAGGELGKKPPRRKPATRQPLLKKEGLGPWN